MKKLLAIGLLFFCLNSFADEFTFKDLSGGMVSFPTANTIPDNSASHIQNFYTDTYYMAEERLGYEKMSTTAIGNPSKVEGLWRFVDVNENEWIVSFSSRSFYKNLSGNAPTVFGQLQTVDKVPDCDSNLGKFWCTDGTDNVWWFDGTSTGAVASAPKGRQLEAWRTRIVIANVATARSSVYFSEDGDGTSWTVGDLEVDPFVKQTGGANDGFPITGLKNYLDALVVFRKHDLWYMQGFDQTDLNVRNVSKEIGCIDGRTIQELDGSLLFLSNRGMEKMTGWTIENISEPIRNLTDELVKNTASERSITQTSESDFSDGTFSQTSSSIQSGSVVLSTMSAVSFVDTSSANFAAGTLTNVSTTVVNGSLTLGIYSSSTTFSTYATGSTAQDLINCVEGFVGIDQQFLSTMTITVSRVTLSLSRDSGYSGTLTIEIKNSATGSLLGSGSIASASVGTTQGDVTCTLTTQASLTAGTTYTIYVEATWDTDNIYGYYTTSGAPFSLYAGIPTVGPAPLYSCYTTDSTARRYRFGLYGYRTLYQTSGNIVSQSFDVGTTTNTWLYNWGTLSASTATPTGTSITWQTQSSSSTTGSWSTLQTATNGVVIPSTVQQYVRYKASLATTDSITTPTINSVTLQTSGFRKSTGSFVSEPFNIGSAITSWEPLFITNTLNNGVLHYQFVSTNTTTVPAIGWTDIVSGQTPSNSTNTYCFIRSTFTITTATQNPTLDSLIVSWSEGSSPLRASGIYDRRYWLSMTTNTTGGTYNDTILLYQRNKSWTLFKGINAGSMAIWRDKQYFGDSTGIGYVYYFDVGNNDDNSAITSEIRTKSFDMGIPHKEKEFNRLYFNFTGNSVYTGSASMYYDIDRSGNEYSLGSVDLNEGTGNLLTKFHFPASNVIQGRELQYILRKSGTGDRLKLDGFITDVYPKEPK